MKCILLFPAWNPYETFSKHTAESQVNIWPPLGILYIAGNLIRAGHSVKVIDGSFNTNDDIIQQVKDFQPDFVGISSTTYAWKSALQTAKDIKALNSNIHITVGGAYAIAQREKAFKDDMAIYIDSLCYTEGEYVTLQILNRLENKTNLSNVLGTIFRDEDGRIITNPPSPPIENLNDIPFPPRFLLGNLNKYVSPPGTYKRLPMTTMFTSRGCSNLCIYCFQIYRDRHIRYRSPENVVSEIEECINKYGIKEIKFLDDQFAGDYSRVEKICDLMIEKKLDITWYASIIAGSVDLPLLKKMKRAGCWAILIGAETGVQKNLDTIQKNVTLQQIEQTVKWVKQAKIKPYTPFMFGIPGETYEDGLKTIKFACKLNPNYVDFNALTPFPGTTIYNNYTKYGTIAEDSNDYTFQHVAFVPYTMTKEQIIKLRQIAFKRFYSRPNYILKKLFEVRSIYDIKALLKGGISLFWIWAGRNIFDPDEMKRKETRRITNRRDIKKYID